MFSIAPLQRNWMWSGLLSMSGQTKFKIRPSFHHTKFYPSHGSENSLAAMHSRRRQLTLIAHSFHVFGDVCDKRCRLFSSTRSCYEQYMHYSYSWTYIGQHVVSIAICKMHWYWVLLQQSPIYVRATIHSSVGIIIASGSCGWLQKRSVSITLNHIHVKTVHD